MYNGYRIKINGIVIKNSMIVRGSYSIKKEQRVLLEYHDGTGTKHQELSPRRTAVIGFTLRERNLQEHMEAMSALAIRNQAEVEYYNDETSEYLIGFFKIDDFTLEHQNAGKNNIQYKETPLTLTEY